MKTRRELLKLAAFAPFLGSPLSEASATIPFVGKFVVNIQAAGAWDVTCFCDPKENQPGERIITNWSSENETQSSGNIRYAPFANNEVFFKKHASKMLVINGVDSQTNAHSIGETVNWSGRTASGYPTLTAMYSALRAPGLPMSYLTFGGFSPSENIIRSTLLGRSPEGISRLLKPNRHGSSSIIDDELWSLINTLQVNDSRSALKTRFSVAGNVRSREAYASAMLASDQLIEFGESLPVDNSFAERGYNGYIKSQAQFAVAAFKAGVSAAADLYLGGFDSHQDNDQEQAPLLTELTDGISYLWDAAEEAGIADRLIVIVGSDFSRTPYYNSGQGKDHWPYGSFVIMEKNAKYTNKMVEGTDELQNALRIDPTTLKPSGFGAKILSSHVHAELRNYLGLAKSDLDDYFPFNNDVRFNFFS